MNVILRMENWITIEKEIEIEMEYLPNIDDLIKYQGDFYKVRTKIFNIDTKGVTICVKEV